MRKIESVHLTDWRESDARPTAYHVQVFFPGYRFPFYVSSFYRGAYEFTSDPLYARCYSYRTATERLHDLMRKGEV